MQIVRQSVSVDKVCIFYATYVRNGDERLFEVHVMDSVRGQSFKLETFPIPHRDTPEEQMLAMRQVRAKASTYARALSWMTYPQYCAWLQANASRLPTNLVQQTA